MNIEFVVWTLVVLIVILAACVIILYSEIRILRESDNNNFAYLSNSITSHRDRLYEHKRSFYALLTHLQLEEVEEHKILFKRTP